MYEIKLTFYILIILISLKTYFTKYIIKISFLRSYQ